MSANWCRPRSDFPRKIFCYHFVRFNVGSLNCPWFPLLSWAFLPQPSLANAAGPRPAALARHGRSTFPLILQGFPSIYVILGGLP